MTGHSLGEIAAAQAAGVFGLEDGLRFAATRGELIAALQEEGAMGAVFAPESRVAEVVDNHNAASGGASLSIAADNGAHQAISGLKTDVEAVLKHFEVEGVRVARLRTSPRISQRPGGTRSRGPGGILRGNASHTTCHSPGKQHDRPTGGTGQDAGRGVLAPTDAGPGSVSQRRRYAGRPGSRYVSGNRPTCGVGTNGDPGLACIGTGR